MDELDDEQLEQWLRQNMHHYFSDDELAIRREAIAGDEFCIVQIFREIDGKRAEIGGFQFDAGMLTRDLSYLKYVITRSSAELAGQIWKALGA